MKKILLSTILILAFAVTAYAVPVRTNVQNVDKAYSPAQEQCVLAYYNMCSGWLWGWVGYCYGGFSTAPLAPQWGVVFDLTDCTYDCRHLDTIWLATVALTAYGNVDCEIFCADENNCPIGAPLGGVYGVVPDPAQRWHPFAFGELELCECLELEPHGISDTGKFCAIMTDNGFGQHMYILSENPAEDILAGCWVDNCDHGHSFVWRNVVDYCAIYGEPGPMWQYGEAYGCTEYPLVPPGCHNYGGYVTGTFLEIQMDAYIACLGPTATEDASWSQIKSLYR